MRKPALILTHNDMDGWCAGAIARLALLAHGEPEPEIRHCGYGMTCPVADAVERQVFVLDFSWPLDDMLALHGAAEQLTWIDHHPQPVKDGRRYVDAVNERGDTGAITVLRTDRCGAWLTWEELRDAFIVRQMPFVIELVDDYDRWVHALNETKAFKNGVDALAQGHGAAWSEWEGLLAEHSTHPNSRSGDVIRTGKILLLAQAERVRMVTKNAIPVTIDGIDAMKVNASCDFNEIADALGHLAQVVWIWQAIVKDDGGERRPAILNSLRSRKGGVDVGEIAKRRGGGGHPSAAGWVCPTETVATR